MTVKRRSIRTVWMAGALGTCLTAHVVGAQMCDGPEQALGPSRDLYCLTLVPVPGLDGLTGSVELAHIPGPFTVTVTVDGRPVYAPRVTLSGLPAPSTLGPYTTYVAWATPPNMYPPVRLGTVSNGTNSLPRIDIDPFVVLITAERSAIVSAPTGRVVLRGGSPSTRLLPPDLLQFSVGAASRPPDSTTGGMDESTMSAQAADHARGAHEPAPGTTTHTDSVRWTTVPMIAGVTMPPAEMALRPEGAPYLPRAGDGEQVPSAHPHQVLALADGDTLRLTAGLVRRTIGGRPLMMYAFNGQSSAPLISVAQGTTITVDFTNHLDQPTSVHWHGIRLDNAFDGAPGLTQSPVPPGGHFIYRVHFTDAGIYWYHSHVREDVQQALGLAGNLLVRSSDPHDFGPANRQEILMLSDLLVGREGLVPFGREVETHAFMGRFGNVLLINGRERYTLAVKRGEVVRFLLTNASSARTFNLSFPSRRMKIVGSDGGNFEHEEWVRSVVIGPAERYIVTVRFDRPGRVPLVNRVRGLDHFFAHFFPETDTLGVVQVSESAVGRDLSADFRVLRRDKAVAQEIDRYRRYFDRPVDRTLVLALETHDLPFVTRQFMRLDSAYFAPIEWNGTMPNMNWAATADRVRWILRDPATGKENMDIGWTFRRGDVIKLRLVNDRRTLHGMQHPIHIHGQRFLVLAVSGVPNQNLVWKDTVLIPAGTTADLLVDMANPGRWMVHCHIAEHLGAQMMTAFTVE